MTLSARAKMNENRSPDAVFIEITEIGPQTKGLLTSKVADA
jgi:hypothetical protein